MCLNQYLKDGTSLDVYSYMTWCELRYMDDVPNSVWTKICEYFYIDISFKKLFDEYCLLNNEHPVLHKDSFLNYVGHLLEINELMAVDSIPRIMWSDRSFILLSKFKYKFIWCSIQLDKQFMMKCINRFPYSLVSVNDIIKRDEDIILAAVKHNGSLLAFAAPECKANRNIVLEAINQNVEALEYADNVFRADPEIILTAMKLNSKRSKSAFGNTVLRLADDALKCNYDFLRSALKIDPDAIYFADDNVKANREFMMSLIKQDGSFLRHADNLLKADKTFMLEVVENNGLQLLYAADILRNDPDLVLTAIKQNPKAISLSSKNLLSNQNFIQEATKQNPDIVNYLPTQHNTHSECTLC